MKNTLKLLGIIALTAVIVFSIAACGGKKDSSSSDSGASSSSAPAASAPAATPAPAASSGSSANNIDSLLADYEKFANDYVELMKKVKNNDFTAIADMQKFTDQAQQWATRWENVSESDFTAAQALKIQEISAKMTSAF